MFINILSRQFTARCTTVLWCTEWNSPPAMSSTSHLFSVHSVVQFVITGRWAFLRVHVAHCRIITNIYRGLLVVDSARRWTGRAWAYFKERNSPWQALISQQNWASSWFPGQVEDAWPPHQLVQPLELVFIPLLRVTERWWRRTAVFDVRRKYMNCVHAHSYARTASV